MEERLVFASRDISTADYICLVLKENDIPFTKEIEGAGEYFAIATGSTFNNEVRIFVNDEDYQKASELIAIINAKKDEKFWHRLKFLGKSVNFDKLIKEEMI